MLPTIQSILDKPTHKSLHTVYASVTMLINGYDVNVARGIHPPPHATFLLSYFLDKQHTQHASESSRSMLNCCGNSRYAESGEWVVLTVS